MPEDRIKSLQDEAREKRLNTNALVNRIVENYLDYHKPASQANMMYLPKNVIKMMLENISEQTLDKATNALNSEIVDFAYLRGDRYGDNLLFNALMTWLSESQFYVTDSFDGNRRIIAVNHNMGLTISKFLSQCLQNILQEGDGKRLTAQATDNSLIFHN